MDAETSHEIYLEKKKREEEEMNVRNVKLENYKKKTIKWNLAAYIPPTLIDSTNMITAHDTNGDGKLQYDEFVNWITEGSTLTAQERKNIAKRNTLFKHSVEFMERIVKRANVLVVEEKPKEVVQEVVQEVEEVEEVEEEEKIEVEGNEVTFVIDLTKPLDMAITHPEEDHSHYPAVITKLKPEGT